MRKISIIIEVTSVRVDPEGYYYLEYVPTVNGKRRAKQRYDSDFDSQTPKEWESKLDKGEAINICLQDFVENHL